MLKIFIYIIAVQVLFACSERSPTQNSLVDNDGMVTISGYLSGVLKKRNGDYKATANIVVKRGQSLKINPGVTIAFEDSAYFIVYGKLEISGTIDMPVISFIFLISTLFISNLGVFLDFAIFIPLYL